MEDRSNPGGEGDRPADPLMHDVYSELRRLARHWMNGERVDHTLQPTALVHEAYLRLAGADGSSFRSRSQFLAAASVAVRRVLVDHARWKNRQRRGGGRSRVELDEDYGGSEGVPMDLLDLDDALTELQELHPRQARIVELRFFGGMTHTEAARTLGISERTIYADWEMARRWLARRLRTERAGDEA